MYFHHRRQLATSTLLLAAMLAGCGGGSGDSGTSGAGLSGNGGGTVITVPVEANAPTLSGNIALDGVNWINYRRNMLGLSTLTRNSIIDRAAQSHSDYQRSNNTVTHDQVSGRPGFTGVTLANRLTAVGYTLSQSPGWAVGEVISAATNNSGFYHAEELITAIYHRFVLFEPVFREIGTGAATTSNNYTYFTADLATNTGLGAGLGLGRIAIYPVNNQTGIPTNFFSDNESPDPVPNQNEVGYPISVHADSGPNGDLTVQSFTVAPRGGATLSTRLLSHATDSATPEKVAAIVPLAPLRANTTYDVSFRGAVHGVTVARDWSFTTR